MPDVGPLDALVRISTTTICGTDVHILRGEYPVAKGLIVGHEPVGIIEKKRGYLNSSFTAVPNSVRNSLFFCITTGMAGAIMLVA